MDHKCILAVFAHPDDETSGSGGTLTKYAHDGAEVYVVTATRGELGTLGTNGQIIEREALGGIREGELRTVLQSYGAHPPILLDYRDQGVSQVDFEEVVSRVLAIMEQVRPSVVITFGPNGISGHDDHVTIHRTTVEAYHRYCAQGITEPSLLYVAIPREVGRSFDLHLDGPEGEPNVWIDIKDYKTTKVRALRSYTSQEDAQWLADLMEASELGDVETFHQVYPPLPPAETLNGLWP